jgi:hypothetical protein
MDTLHALLSALSHVCPIIVPWLHCKLDHILVSLRSVRELLFLVVVLFGMECLLPSHGYAANLTYFGAMRFI